MPVTANRYYYDGDDHVDLIYNSDDDSCDGEQLVEFLRDHCRSKGLEGLTMCEAGSVLAAAGKRYAGRLKQTLLNAANLHDFFVFDPDDPSGGYLEAFGEEEDCGSGDGDYASPEELVRALYDHCCENEWDGLTLSTAGSVLADAYLRYESRLKPTLLDAENFQDLFVFDADNGYLEARYADSEENAEEEQDASTEQIVRCLHEHRVAAGLHRLSLNRAGQVLAGAGLRYSGKLKNILLAAGAELEGRFVFYPRENFLEAAVPVRPLPLPPSPPPIKSAPKPLLPAPGCGPARPVPAPAAGAEDVRVAALFNAQLAFAPDSHGVAVCTCVALIEHGRHEDALLALRFLLACARRDARAGAAPSIGLDFEWRPQLSARGPVNPLALVQLSCGSHTVLLRLSPLPRPGAGALHGWEQLLVDTLRDAGITKAVKGFGVSDAPKVEAYFGLSAVHIRALFELNDALFRRCGHRQTDAAVRRLFPGAPPAKNKSITLSDWATRGPLSAQQVRYAAYDAWSAWMLHRALHDGRL